MKTLLPFLLLGSCLTCFACSQSSATKDQLRTETIAGHEQDAGSKLYLVTTMRSWGLSIDFVYLGSQNRILFNPTLGINPPDYAAEQKKNPGSSGTYELSGNTMRITWSDGKKDEWSVEHRDGEISSLNGGISTRQKPLPDGYRIAGKFSAGAVMPNVAASNTIQFNKDGSFAMNSLASVSPEGAHTASKTSNTSGTYAIKGNTLLLNFADGTRQKAVITEMNLGGKPHYIINGESYRKEE
jgi:hypothetical protein